MSDPVFQALIESNRRMTEVFENKITEIDKTLDESVKAVPEAIRTNMNRNVYVDGVTGNDANYGSKTMPVKTVNQAMRLVPQGAIGQIWLRPGQTFEVLRDNLQGSEKNLIIGAWGSVSENNRPIFKSMPTSFGNEYHEICAVFESMSKVNVKFMDVEVHTGHVSDSITKAPYGGSVGELVNGGYGGFFSRGGGVNEMSHFSVQFIRCTIRQQDFRLFTFYYGNLALSMSRSRVINEGANLALCDKEVPKILDIVDVTFEGFAEGATLKNLFKLTDSNYLMREITDLDYDTVPTQ